MYSDGPHIFYRENYLIERYYQFSDSGIQKIEKEIPFDETTKISITSPFSTRREVPIPIDFPTDKDSYHHVQKIAALGDIHGEFDLLIEVLKHAQIIDEDLNWSFGNGHLVFCGDIFDRGEQVTECLWLIYILEQEAKLAGGKVHFLLGNHEIMAINNDLRYLAEKYFRILQSSNTTYSEHFSNNTFLGRWLRYKNTVVKINDIVFVHGGLSPRIVKENFSIGQINGIVRERFSGKSVPTSETIFGSEGPFWYRGYLMHWLGRSKISEKEVELICNHFDASKIVFAHTPTSKIQVIYDELIAIDVSLEKGRNYQYLFFEDKNWEVKEVGL